MKDLDKAFTLRLVTGECMFDGFGRGSRIPGASKRGAQRLITEGRH